MFVCSTKEVVMLVSELICQLPGKQACAAVGIAFDMYVESKGLHMAQGDLYCHLAYFFTVKNYSRSAKNSEN